MRKLAHLGLWQITQRKAQKLELFACGGKEELALVAISIYGAIERASAFAIFGR
jgi:hypothetical protein